MNRIRWLSLLIVCLWASGNVAASSDDLAGVKSAAAVQQDFTAPLTAMYMGKTVIRTTEPLVLRSSRDVAAASYEVVLTDFSWKLNGRVVSTSSELVISLPESGDYSLQLSYRDFQENRYAATINVRVMEPAEYDTMMAAVGAAVNLPLWLEDDEIFLPIVYKTGRDILLTHIRGDN